MRICIITDNKNSYSSKKFFKEATAKNIKVDFILWKSIFLDEKGVIFGGDIPLNEFDGVILRSSKKLSVPNIVIVEYCKANNIRLLNKDFYFRYQSTNKLRQYLIFKTKEIPCLETFYGEKVSYSFLKRRIGLPFVAKSINGSLGKQIFKIKNRQEFENFIRQQKVKKQLYIFQKFYSGATDYRVFIVGKKVFGPVKRIAPLGKWKTNEVGSAHKRCEKEKRVLNLAKKIAQKTKIEFAGLDILIDAEGQPRIIEMNTMGVFRVFDTVYPEIDIAKKTIELMVNTMK